MAFANVYGSKCVGIGNAPHAAPNNFFAEGFWSKFSLSRVQCAAADDMTP